MFSIGSIIRDRAGNEWVVTQTWTYNQYLCLALIGKMGGAMQGQMGGARFRSGDEIYIRR
jgi:hypothetical protein